MDLVPLRAAAGGGSIDGIEATQLVAAGFTLLQRSAPLVRALAGRRSAILLPNSAHFLTALAASDGRGAVLIPLGAARAEVAALIEKHNVGAIFTLTAFAERLFHPATPRILLDESPRSAHVVIPPLEGQHIDLGSHFGIELSGDDDAPGREEECVLIAGVAYTHRALLDRARRAIEDSRGAQFVAKRPFTEPDGLVHDLIAPLIAGAHITTA